MENIIEQHLLLTLPILPVEVIQEILTEMLLIVPYDVLLIDCARINKFCFSMIGKEEFKKIRYETNPTARDSRVFYGIIHIVGHMKTMYWALFEHRHLALALWRMSDGNRNTWGISIKLIERYNSIYQRLGIDKDKLKGAYGCNTIRLEVFYVDSKYEQKFLVYFSNNGVICRDVSYKITSNQLVDILFHVMCFDNIVVVHYGKN